MQIAFRSRYGIPFVQIPQLLDANLKTWSNGQERDIPDDLMVAVKPRPDAPVVQVKAWEAILMSGPDFVDVKTGVNPDYACSVCGKETLSDWHQDVLDDNATLGTYAYEDADGNRLCEVDYLLQQGPGSRAWRYHELVERSGAIDKARQLHAAAVAEADQKAAAAPSKQVAVATQRTAIVESSAPQGES